MPVQINSGSDFFRQTQDDIFADGKNDTTSPNAGGTVTVSLADGRKSTTVAVDGDLTAINNSPTSTNPTANSSGNSTVGYTRNVLLRWIIKVLQSNNNELTKIDRGLLTAANTSTANTSATFTISAPGSGNFTQLSKIYFGYDAAPTGGTLTVSATGMTSIVVPVTAAGAGFLPMPLRCPTNTAVTVTLSAGGAAVIGRVAAIYKTVTF